jgi:hypothetical protein
MNAPWAARLPLAHGGELLRLWNTPGVEVCAVDGALWLRGADWDERLDRAIRSMLGSERFAIEDDLLIPLGDALPVDEAPQGPWSPLRQWFHLTAPPRGFAARLSQRVPLELQRSTEPQAVNLLLTSWATWHDYAVAAPAVRLACWSFAASDDGHALIRGAPTPPLAGKPWVETDGVAVPAGWTWSPPLDAAALRLAFAAEEDDLILLHADGAHEVLPADSFVKATRSAVRLTARSPA